MSQQSTIAQAPPHAPETPVTIRCGLYAPEYNGKGRGFVWIILPERPYERIHLPRLNRAAIPRLFGRVVQSVAVGIGTVSVSATELEAVRQIPRDRNAVLNRQKYPQPARWVPPAYCKRR